MYLRSGIKSAFTLMLVFALATCSVRAQNLSLQNVLDSIERNNPMLASVNYKVTAAHTLASGAKSWMPPMVGIGFDQTPYKVPDGETFFNRTDGSAVLMVQQDIPNPAKLKAKSEYLTSL